MCACSYEPEECHGLFCCYYMFMGGDVMGTGQWTHQGHTHTACPQHDSTTVGWDAYICHLVFECSLMQKLKKIIPYIIIPYNNALYLLVPQEEDTTMSRRRSQRKSIFLSSLLVSLVSFVLCYPDIIDFLIWFDDYLCALISPCLP